jgi:ATP-dependent DNA ligase
VERRIALDAFAAANLSGKATGIKLSPATIDLAQAHAWLDGAGSTLDGVIAKRRDLPYRSGDRTGMQKVKRLRSVDCVVGGFRYSTSGGAMGSLLLGLYDAQGRLDYVGFCSSFAAKERKALTPRLEALMQPPGFDGTRVPGGKSRWTKSERSGCHGTGFLRWRPDKAPRQCTADQVEQKAALSPLAILH